MARECLGLVSRTLRTAVPGLLAAGAMLLAASPVAHAAKSASPCAVSARACVDLATQQAWLLRDGNISYGPVPVATGKASAPTDPGTFHVYWKDIDHRSSLFDNAPMPYSVFFNGGEAFHQDSVTVPSHGCVHLDHRAAQTFYNALRIGDVVQVVR